EVKTSISPLASWVMVTVSPVIFRVPWVITTPPRYTATPCLSSSSALSACTRIGWSRSLGRAQALALPNAAPRQSSRGKVLTNLMLASYVGQQVDLAVVQVRFHSLRRGHPIGGLDSNGLPGLRIFLVGEYGDAAAGDHGGAVLGIGAGDAHVVDQLDLLALRRHLALVAAHVPGVLGAAI